MRIHLCIVPAIFCFCLLLAFSRVPLLDRTESRVAVIADRLVNTSDFLHPHVPHNGTFVPYVAKPPLHYWIVATSIKLLGRSEFSARLPSLLAALGILFLVPLFLCADPIHGQLIIASSLLFFFGSGVALIDASLALALAVALLGFYRWIVLEEHSIVAALLMSGGIAFACALKGLVGLAIPGLSVLLYCAFRQRLSPVYQLPWGTLCLVSAALLGSYYGFVEYHNPGFLKHFFLRENILRFLTKEYGPTTGSGHQQMYGTSIIFGILAFLPWSPLLLRSLWQRKPTDNTDIFLISSMLAPILLFLFARQHLATYQIPAILPAALLLADRLTSPTVVRLSLATLILFALFPRIASQSIGSNFSSASIFEEASAQGAREIHFQEEAPLSAYWYASKEVSFDLQTPLEAPPSSSALFAVRNKHHDTFFKQFSSVCEFNKHRVGKWEILSCPPRTSDSTS